MGLSLLSLVCSNPSRPDNRPPVEEINFMEGWPSWSPDGRYITYTHDAANWDEGLRFGSRSIWIYDCITKHHGFLVGPGLFPRWNPDGSIIAFNCGSEIFFYYMETGTVRQVTNLGREIFTMRFTPDGTRLCVTYADILLIDTTGRVAKTIRPFDGQDTGWGIGSDANWSITGESLLVTGSFVRGIWGAVLIDSFGGLLSNIINPQQLNEQVSDIAWSPRRNQFAANYQVDIGNQIYNDIRIYRMDGSVETIISEQAGMADWSPDGSKIVYQQFTWMGDNPDPNSIDYSRVTIWETDSHGRFKHELMGWPQQGFDSTMIGGGYNWATDTHAP
jgi:Tol biopolymer transport system component